MADNTFMQRDYSRHDRGFVSKATGNLKTGYNKDGAIMLPGVAIKLAADQTGADVWENVQTINAAADVIIGFAAEPKVQNMHFSLAGISDNNNYDPVSGLIGWERDAAIAYTDEEYIYVTADVAVTAGQSVHVVAATPHRVRGAATAGVTSPATGWRFRQNAAAGQSVRIEKMA